MRTTPQVRLSNTCLSEQHRGTKHDEIKDIKYWPTMKMSGWNSGTGPGQPARCQTVQTWDGRYHFVLFQHGVLHQKKSGIKKLLFLEQHRLSIKKWSLGPRTWWKRLATAQAPAARSPYFSLGTATKNPINKTLLVNYQSSRPVKGLHNSVLALRP